MNETQWTKLSNDERFLFLIGLGYADVVARTIAGRPWKLLFYREQEQILGGDHNA